MVPPGEGPEVGGGMLDRDDVEEFDDDTCICVGGKELLIPPLFMLALPLFPIPPNPPC